ncbi:MAG TPA: hypothetical protein VGN82_08175 [Bosea sp. (in: a-proteobacteria)]|uniref:hypothetical protein n=1 Tax=Bosea sp. (in: a-proteobacteria) TaxID=1871050 RepID=UPI002E1494F9|nr:hypothetical protein [Bosea sp. (in: a-proteobacteria)]
MPRMDNPAVASLKIEQRAQRQAARRKGADGELSDALKATFPASDPVAAQAPVTAGGAPTDYIYWMGEEAEELKEMAGEGFGNLEQLLSDEIRARPLRAIAWAAAAGAIVGFFAAR